MFALLKRETRAFFSSLTGYLILSIFLIATGLFIWVFPGAGNPLSNGYANLNILFEIAPWIYLFLIPAITMRLFAEEKKQGTMELVFTRPISDRAIVIAKYLSALIIIGITLLCCLVYYISIYQLGNPVGNIDSGAFIGSFIGLLFLGMVYASVGVFCSAITNNQIIAFLMALAGCFILYSGFDYIAEMDSFQYIQSEIYALGIGEHYRSMSRGVIDSRDMLYFVGTILSFLLLTETVLRSRKW